MNSYLIEIDDYTKCLLEEKKIIEKEGFCDALSSVYDLDEVGLDSVLEDLDTYGFLSSKKIIKVFHIENFKVDDEKKHYEHLMKYLDNPDPDKLLIFEAKKLNRTTKVAKDLLKKCKVLEGDISSKAFIKECMKDYQIGQDAINLLDEYCLGDFTKIKSECDKLKNYRYDEKKITKEDISSMVSRKLGDPKDLTFSFSRSIASRDIKSALSQYQELLNYQFEPLSIIGLLASQLRIIYQVKLLTKKRLSDQEIGNMLGEKEFRIKKTRELIPYFTEGECLNYLIQLSDIDTRIKTTDTDSYRELELFILNL